MAKTPRNPADREPSPHSAPGQGFDSIRTPTEPGSSTPSLGFVQARRTYDERGYSLERMAELTGCAESTLSPVMSGKSNPGPRTRAAIEKLMGVSSASWDKRVDAPKQPLAPPTTTCEASDAPDLSGLEIARANLATIQTELLDANLSEAGRIRLLAQVSTTAKTIAQLSGEMDRAELQRFYQSPEFKNVVAKFVGAVGDCPACRDRVQQILTTSRTKMRPKWRPMRFDELAEYCEHTENHYNTDDLGPALDGLQYPISERERELVQHDFALAKRCLAALELGHPIMVSGEHSAFQQADDHREAVIQALRAEIAREERIAVFTKDFGAIAAQKAREAFESPTQQTEPRQRPPSTNV